MDFTRIGARMADGLYGLFEPYDPPEPPRLYEVQESKEFMDFDGFLMDSDGFYKNVKHLGGFI